MGKQVVILGGGASGLVAAIAAARSGAYVTILEQNEKPGKKLLASGNGKCNLTNRALDPHAYHSDDPRRVQEILDAFSVEDTIAFFEQLGLRVFDRSGWVYPCTEQAASVRDLLLFEAERLGVKCKNQEEVVSITRDEIAAPYLVHTRTWKYPADAVVLCCGSMASAVRGSSDTAIRLADALGLPRYPFLPALVPLRVREPVSQVWNGTRCHAEITLYVENEPCAVERGELQMTAYGVSGIPILQLSRPAVRALQEDRAVRLTIDFLPEMTQEEVEETWRDRVARFPERTNQQLLTGLLPEKVIAVLLGHARLRPQQVPLLTDHAEGGPIEVLLAACKAFPLTVQGSAPYEQAQICTGGIALSALDSHLCLQKWPGFYVAGEAVHVDGPCGGYNLQWAWSSGMVAGRAAAER